MVTQNQLLYGKNYQEQIILHLVKNQEYFLKLTQKDLDVMQEFIIRTKKFPMKFVEVKTITTRKIL